MNSKQYSILVGAVMVMIILGVIVLLMVWGKQEEMLDSDDPQESLTTSTVFDWKGPQLLN